MCKFDKVDASVWRESLDNLFIIQICADMKKFNYRSNIKRIFIRVLLNTKTRYRNIDRKRDTRNLNIY